MKFYFRVTPAPHHLSGSVQAAIHKAVDAAEVRTHEDSVTIPHSVVDELLAADRQKGELAYTVYLLNPAAASKRYLYRGPEQAQAAHGGGCASPLWVGKERYVWVDLTAGPAEYGPHSSGAGAVRDRSLPRPEQYLRSQHNKGECFTALERRLMNVMLSVYYSASPGSCAWPCHCWHRDDP
eukprot:4412512-Pyramimonas_sp.AAC.1